MMYSSSGPIADSEPGNTAHMLDRPLADRSIWSNSANGIACCRIFTEVALLQSSLSICTGKLPAPSKSASVSMSLVPRARSLTPLDQYGEPIPRYLYVVPNEILERTISHLSVATLKRVRLASRLCRTIAVRKSGLADLR